MNCKSSLYLIWTRKILVQSVLLLILGALATIALQSQTFTVLHSFTGGTDGGSPYAGLIMDPTTGYLYGTTAGNGTNGHGVVFIIDPSDPSLSFNVLHSFTGADGAFPTAGLIMDQAGYLHGTTVNGGASGSGCGGYGCGTAFTLDPHGNETSLYSFLGPDGGNPYAGLIMDPGTNYLYGTTNQGGATGTDCGGFGCGTVFQFDPQGNQTVLHSFTLAEEFMPYGGLIIDPATGNLYGTTQYDGVYGYGVVFQLDQLGNLTALHSFTGGADGGTPYAGLVKDPATGYLYGTTYYGGASGPSCSYGCGTVFKLDPLDPLGSFSVLHSFTGADGEYPIAGLIRDTAGNLYGTTEEGGASGYGVVFKLDPLGNLTVLHNFTGAADGAGPWAGLIVDDSTGSLYGTTVGGGSGYGVVFKLTIPGYLNQAPAITSASSTAFTVGAAGSFKVTASGSPEPTLSEAGTLPSGVTFNATTGVLSGTPAAGTGGTYKLTFTASNGVSPDATQNFTLTVNQAPVITSTSITTFTVGAPGSFTVTATGFPVPGLSESGALPSGVTFTNNGNGTATLAGTPSVSGSYPITISATNAAGTGTQNFTLTVSGTTQAPAITSANSATFTIGVIGSFTITATGSPAPKLTESGTLPGGVAFIDNGNGTATLGGTPVGGTTGTYILTFTASNGVGSNATQRFALTVIKEPTSAVVTSSGNPSLVGQPVTFTATVNSSIGAPLNGDTITFLDGTTSIGTGTLSAGVATFTTSLLAAGTHHIRASYVGDTAFSKSTSTAILQMVNKYATSTAVVSNLNPSIYGQPITFTATVTAAGPYPVTGWVEFRSGSNLLLTLHLSGNTASFTFPSFAAGSRSITSVYSGDANNAGSTSPILTQTVNKRTTALALTSSPNPSAFGTAVMLTSTVTSTAVLPTGSVTFRYRTMNLGSATWNASGVATLTTTKLPSGSDTVTASYPGTSNFAASSGSVVQTVN